MSTSKSSGTSRLGRDSAPKYLGIKKGNGQKVVTGQILLRQRGTKVLAGTNVAKGRDDTLYAAADGIVKFSTKRKRGFNRLQRAAKVLSVITS